MSTRAHLTPESTTDKNGKQTTVYRRSDNSGTAPRMASVPPVSRVAKQPLLASSLLSLMDTSSTVSRDRATLKRALIPSMTSKHVAGDRSNRIRLLDRTTLMLAASAVRKKLITKDQLGMITGMENDETREYIALATTVSDFGTNGSYLRAIYYGSCDADEEANSYERIDLSSEESLSYHSAIMRFSIAFQESQANSLQRFNSIYTERRVDSKPGQVLNEDLRDLVSRRPNDIGRIIELMDGSDVIHAAGLEHMLDTNSALSEGAL